MTGEKFIKYDFTCVASVFLSSRGNVNCQCIKMITEEFRGIYDPINNPYLQCYTFKVSSN